MKKISLALASAFGLSVVAADIAGAGDDRIAYPDGYRAWTHVKSMVILPDHPLADPFQGIHHVYANPKALTGLEGGTFADGAVLVFDLLNYAQGEGAGQEGSRKLVGVMVKSASKYAATGGWGYEGFAGDSRTDRLVTDGAAQCHGCHVGTEDTGYVFSRYRE